MQAQFQYQLAPKRTYQLNLVGLLEKNDWQWAIIQFNGTFGRVDVAAPHHPRPTAPIESYKLEMSNKLLTHADGKVCYTTRCICARAAAGARKNGLGGESWMPWRRFYFMQRATNLID